MDWRLHWLETEGSLKPWREAIVAEVEQAYRAIARVVPPSRLDILIQHRVGEVILETGTTGFAYRPSLFALSIDPVNPNFAASLTGGDIKRTIVHEAHHCMRMGGAGYGHTLGEALVSEGLAGRFVSHLFGSGPDPWECAVDEAGLNTHRPGADDLIRLHYDRASWFFGADGRRPRRLGYTLGYRIVGDWLAQAQNRDDRSRDNLDWINVPAATVLAASDWSRPRA